MRLVHLKTDHFGENSLTSFTVSFLLTRTHADQFGSFLVSQILTVFHTLNLRHKRALGSKNFQSSDNLKQIICFLNEPASYQEYGKLPQVLYKGRRRQNCPCSQPGMYYAPVDISQTVMGESPNCLLLSGIELGENPDHVILP